MVRTVSPLVISDVKTKHNNHKKMDNSKKIINFLWNEN